MKRLIVALVAAVAASVASARITETQLFEDNNYTNSFLPSVQGEDLAELAAYDGDQPASSLAPYPCSGFGDKYLSLDTGDATLWCSNTAAGNVYFDMVVQFNICKTMPSVDGDTKIAVYLNSDSNLVVVAGDGTSSRTATEYVLDDSELEPGTWGRLTISALAGEGGLSFNVCLDGTKLSSGQVDSFQCLTADTTVSQFGIAGSGALDDFVIRTTDPFIQNPAVSVGGEGYATFDEALADLEDGQYIELLADASTTFGAAGISVAVRENNHALTVATTGDIAVTRTLDGSTGLAIYTTADGVACLNGTWYATFDAAYAKAAANTDTLVVKLSGDFAPTLSESKAFSSVTFTTESADPIAIATASGDNAFTASTWSAPSTATLTLSANQTVASVTAGTVNVPAGITLSLANGSSLDGIGTGYLAGDGVVSLPSVTVPSSTLQLLLQKSAYWHGTFALNNTDVTGGQWNLTLMGNANSTVRFNNSGFSFKPDNISAHAVKAIEVVGGGLFVSGDYDGGTITIPAKVFGSGKITVEATGSALYTVNFTGDFSEFAGDLEILSESNGRVYIGTGCAGNGKCISIANGATATVAAGKTWNTQNGFVVLGTLNVAGTLKHQGGSAANQIFGNTTTGKIVFKNAAAITTFGGNYAGEIVIDSIAAGNTSTQVPLNFGCSSAKLTLNGVSGNAWCAGTDNYTIQPAVTLAGDVNFQNGYSEKTVTFRKLAAGTGDLTLKTWNGCRGITYDFTEIDADNYSGTITLDGSVMTSTIGNIIKAGASAGDKVLDLVTANDAAVVVSSTTLNGEAAKLVKLADGIYVAVDIAIPAVANMTASVTADGVATEIVDGNVAVAPGARVVVTYTANEGYVGGGEVVIASASASSTVDTTGISASLGVAKIGDTLYATLKEAIDAATAGQTVAVIADCAVAEPITFTCGITVSNDYAVSVTAAYALRMFNGTASPVTFCGSGTYTCNGTGSPFLVGNNEDTGKSSYGISGTFAGSMVLESGTLKIPGTSNNLVKIENGTFVMDGGSILGGSRGIKADADAGDFTATVTINGGVVSNAVNKTAVAASADTGTATVTINGGDIIGPITCGQDAGTATVTIPGASTARFDADRSTFCAAGYETTQSGDWYVVTAKPYYTIKFISGEGSTTNESSIMKGEAVVAPTPAAVADKRFTGWDPDVVSPAAGDATYTAQYEAIAYVAQIGANKYETLAAAVAAAADGDVITLLGDLELDARVEPNVANLAFNLGGYTLSRAGTSGNGSVIDVKGGNVVITNGTIDCTQDDAEILGDGVYALTARSGATITLDNLTVAVDSKNGACVYPFDGATVTINGGTYRNDTADVYQYGRFNAAGLRGMAVNQANVATQLITIYGGSFKQVNPALGDDSWAEGAGTFLASGKAATYNASTGYWDVGDAGTPLEPGEDDGKTYDDQASAQAAAESVVIVPSTAVSEELSGAVLEAYLAKFEAKAVAVEGGKYKVVVAMTDEAATDLQNDVSTNVYVSVAAKLSDIVADAAGDTTEISVANATPGFYYWISYGTSIGAMNTIGTAVMADDEGALTLETPEKASNATAGFYRVNASPEPPVTP